MRALRIASLIFLAGGVIMLSGGFLLESPNPTPVNISLTYSTETGCQGGCSIGPPQQVPDNLGAGTIVATATVTMSDGSQCVDFTNVCHLTSSNPAFFSISGANIVTQHALTSLDDGTQTAVISTQ